MMQDRVTFGLKRNTANALIWLFGAISGVIFYFGYKSDYKIKHKAMQSILLSATIFLIEKLSSFAYYMPVIGDASGWIFSRVSIALGVLAVVFVILDFMGKDVNVPIISSISSKIVKI